MPEGILLCVGGFIVLVGLILSGVWIGSAMIVVGFLGCLWLERSLAITLSTVSETVLGSLFQYTLSAIPLFVFMGEILYRAKIGDDIFQAARALLGRVRGGLGIATTMSCAIFAAITGLSAPALVTMGLIALPEMRRAGYSVRLAAGTIAASAPLAFLIPPSVAFIIYGILTEQSIGKLFMAGVVPGVILTVFYATTVALLARKSRNNQSREADQEVNVRRALSKSWHVCALILLLLCGIYLGIITPTEAGAIGAGFSLAFSFLSRRTSAGTIWLAAKETIATTGIFLYLLVGAYVFSKFVLLTGAPNLIAEKVVSAHLSPVMFVVCLAIIYLLLGMFTEIVSAVIMTIPVVYPAVLALHIDPIWFGVFIVLVVQLGVVTPPVGLDVYVLSRVANIPPEEVFRGVALFIPAVIALLALLCAFPKLALWLPYSM